MIEGNIPSATVALVSGDKVIWTGAYGESNLWARTPATVDTVYLIGSTFKAMSTVALLQQMEQGKFKLDDPVSKYLDFKIQGEDPKNPITFRHLFTHTSGLDGDFGAVPLWSNTATTTLDEYVRTNIAQSNPSADDESALFQSRFYINRLSGRETCPAFHTGSILRKTYSNRLK
jgi:CubicO group peptidase (beta-lactamase class C family)